MATVGEAKSRKKGSSEESVKPEAPRRPRRGKLLWLLLALFIALVAFLPTIAAKTPLRNLVLNRALGINGSVRAGSASFGWISAPVLNELEIRDAEGETVITVDSLSGSKSLTALVFSGSRMGRVALTHPVVKVVVDADGQSNLEEIFEPLLQGGSSSPVAVEVEITEGVLSITDKSAERTYQIEDLEARIATGLLGEAPLAAELSGTLPTNSQPTSFEFKLATNPTQDGSMSAGGKLAMDIDSLALDMLAPFARRFLADTAMSGWLSAKLDCVWGDGERHDKSAAQGKVWIDDLAVTAAALKGDELRLKHVEIPCDIEHIGDVLRFRKLSLNCDVGQMSLTGQARTVDFAAKDLVVSLGREEYSATGEVDLASLARMLPATLRLREGTELTGGDLKWEMSTKPHNDALDWIGRVTTSNLTGRARGKKLTWKEPLVAEFSAHEDANGFSIEQASCTSSFLQVDAKGALDDMTATIQYDLAQLVAEVEQFVDLGDFRVAGQGNGQIRLKRSEDGRISATGDLKAHDFQLVADGRRPWSEPSVNARFEAAGLVDGGALKKLDSAKLRVDAGSERCAVVLTGPVEKVSVGPWPLQIDWQGEIADWLPRLESIVSLSGWDLAGKANVSAAVTYSATAVDIREATIHVAPLHAWGHGLYLDESKADLNFAGNMSLAKTDLEISKGALTVGALAVRIDKAHWSGGDAAGNATVDADLAQIDHWLHEPRTTAQFQIAGRLQTDARLSYASGVTSAQLNGQIDNLEWADLSTRDRQGRATTEWREQKLSLTAKIAHDEKRHATTIDTAELVASALRLALRGSIATSARQDDLDLSGTIEYDWQKLAPLWRPYLGANSQVVGHETRNFSIRGPWPAGAKTYAAGLAQLTGEGSFGWSQAEVYGFPVGKADIRGQLAGGKLAVGPIDLAVSDGRLTGSPVVNFMTQPAMIEVTHGPLLNRVHVTPELCARGLKYAAPILANATQAEGLLSLQLGDGKLPLLDPAGGNLPGRLQIHAVELRAGAFAGEILGLARQVESILNPSMGSQGNSLVSINNQDVDFRLVDRRVYHRNLQFKAGPITVTTHGSVGVDDESLAIIAVFNVPDSQLNRLPLVSRTKSKAFEVPIEGTLSKPKFDAKIIPALAGSIVEGAVEEATGKLLEPLGKQLDKLLPPQK